MQPRPTHQSAGATHPHAARARQSPRRDHGRRPLPLRPLRRPPRSRLPVPRRAPAACRAAARVSPGSAPTAAA
eukprot:7248648-Prymnesium_polylepis.2